MRSRRSGRTTSRRLPTSRECYRFWIIIPKRCFRVIPHATEPYNLIDLSVKKARTETGLSSIRPAYEDIYSLEIIATSGYYKEPNYIPSHLHLNLTYLLEADESEEIKTDESETCGAKWFDLRRAAMLSNGAWIRSIYEKLNAKLDIS